MFIFSSNASRYTFEYRPSKPYRIEYKEKLGITPSVFKTELYRSIQNFSSDYINDGVVVGLAVSDFTLRDLTVSQLAQDTTEVNIAVADFSLKDLVVSNGVTDGVTVGTSVADVSLLNLVISQSTGDTTSVSFSISDFSLN